MAELPPFPRELLNTVFNGDVRMISAFEALIDLLQASANAVEEAGGQVVNVVGGEFILAAASAALTNGRVLVDGHGITISYGAGSAEISHPIEVVGGEATFILTGATVLAFPTAGTVATTADILAFFTTLAGTASYANDAAAAAGGVQVGGAYRNGSVVQIRIV